MHYKHSEEMLLEHHKSIRILTDSYQKQTQDINVLTEIVKECRLHLRDINCKCQLIDSKVDLVLLLCKTIIGLVVLASITKLEDQIAYAKTVKPIDRPESSPKVEMQPDGNTGV